MRVILFTLLLIQLFGGAKSFRLSSARSHTNSRLPRLKGREETIQQRSRYHGMLSLRGGQLQVVEAAAVHTVLGSLLALSKQKSLTQAGLAHSTALGFGLWSFLGPQGWAVCASYLLLGSVVTKVKLIEKEVGII